MAPSAVVHIGGITSSSVDGPDARGSRCAARHGRSGDDDDDDDDEGGGGGADNDGGNDNDDNNDDDVHGAGQRSGSQPATSRSGGGAVDVVVDGRVLLCVTEILISD